MTFRSSFRPFFSLVLFASLLLALLGLGTIRAAHAAENDVWTDATGNHLWSIGPNWSLGVAPGPNNVAFFSGTYDIHSKDDVTIDVAASVIGLQIDSSYIGRITVASNLFIYGSWFQDNGIVIVPSSQYIAVGGDWAVSRGIFISGAGTVDISGYGIHHLDSGFQSFNNLTSSGTLLLGTPLYVSGTLQSSGTLDTNHQDVSAGALQLSSGTLATTIHTSITVSGAANLSSETLSVSNTGVPSGEIFPVLTAGTLSGTFATTAFSGTVSYPGNAVVLTAAVTGTDLALTNVPADITTAATGPSGATVTYASPTVNDDSGQGGGANCVPASGSTFAIGTTTVTCTATDSDDTPGTVSGSFSVIVQPLLTVIGTSVSATEGSVFSGVVAIGTAHGTTNPLTASIDWGDGNSSTVNITPGSDGSYSIPASHTYAEEGQDTIHIVVSDGSGHSASTNIPASVGDATLTLTHFVAGPLGHLLGGVAANFTDADSSGQVSDYTATITWGDGATSTVKVIANPLGKGFVLGGLHKYAMAGTYTMTLTVTDTGGSQLTKTAIVTIK